MSIGISGYGVLWNIAVLSFFSTNSGNPFVLAMRSIRFHSFFLFLWFEGNRCFVVTRDRKATVLYSVVCLDVN